MLAHGGWLLGRGGRLLLFLGGGNTCGCCGCLLDIFLGVALGRSGRNVGVGHDGQNCQAMKSILWLLAICWWWITMEKKQSRLRCVLGTKTHVGRSTEGSVRDETLLLLLLLYIGSCSKRGVLAVHSNYSLHCVLQRRHCADSLGSDLPNVSPQQAPIAAPHSRRLPGLPRAPH